MAGQWKDTTVAAACRSTMTPRATVQEWASRIGRDVVGMVDREVLEDVLGDLDGKPFSCGHDEAGDPACGDPADDPCCVLAAVRLVSPLVVALLGLMVVGTAEGHYRDEAGVEQARVKRFLRGLHESAMDLDEGLAQFFADHC